ncbi:MAG: hypothetical protein D6759_01180 [Chloroflexi bacterium]|nr:MAG: hypothetical protein D6759_01180 [Chloroflexota bacterium]
MQAQRLKYSLANLGLVLVLVALVVGLPLAARAQGPAPQGTMAALGTGFTYQGRLADNNGNPLSGTYDFQFKLYDASTGGSQVGSTVTKSGVSVSGGLFSVELDFGDVFDGTALWLEVAVKKPTESSYTTLGRQKLTAAPYALGLRSGITVQGSESGHVFGAVNTDSSGSNAALFGETKSGSGAGVSGWNTASSGGYGVYGRNTADAGTPYGVYGWASGSSAASYGVYGKSDGFLGTGVGGEGQTGVYGKAVGGTLISPSYGVYAEADPSGVSYGIYSDGDAHVNGQLTWKPITSYLSIPAAAFVPQNNYTDQTYNGGSIVRSTASPGFTFNAPVFLPHSATVTKMTAYWYDNYSGGDGTITLRRTPLNTAFSVKLAEVNTSGNGGNGTSADTSIDYAQIDNSQYTYYLTADLPTDGTSYVGLYGVVIEYTIGQPY